MSSRVKGRLLPSNLSRSRHFAALSLHGKALYPLLVANADDQGRLSGDPEGLKWTVCPNVSEIGSERIPELLAEMQRAGLLIIYEDGAETVIQLALWWDDQSSMQWAYPSEFAPPKAWDDRLRFRGRNRVITINWPGVADGAGDIPLSQIAEGRSGPGSLAIALGKALGKRQHEHEHEHEGYPPYPPLPQAPPAQRPHAGQVIGNKKKEAHHGRGQRRRAAPAAASPRLPWKEIAGDD